MANQSWVPQSPDLSGYAPQSPDLSAYKPKLANNDYSGWTRQSPNIGAPQNYHNGYIPQPSHFSLDGQHHFAGPQSVTSYPAIQQPGFDSSTFPGEMPTTRSSRIKAENAEWLPNQSYQQAPPPQYVQDIKPAVNPPAKRMDTRGIEVRTKFPTARIKRIMQADEDVGKVAQVTPVVMAKALELFMIRLITASADIAKSRSSKRVLTAHMKQAVMQDDQFDNLREIVGKVPDAPQKKSGHDSDDDDGEGPKKRKKSTAASGKVKKRRGSEDDDF